MGVGFAELITLFFIALLLGGLIAGIILWATSGSGGSGEMACRACGYAVRGLSELNCPECGVDLREAGIGKAGSKTKKTWGMALTFGSVGVFLLMCLLSTFLFVGASVPSSTPSSISIPATPHSTSGSSLDSIEAPGEPETEESSSEADLEDGTADTP